MSISAAASAAAAASTTHTLEPGDIVELHGLKKAQKYNGAYGVVRHLVDGSSDGRWSVGNIARGNQTVSIKPGNLKRVPVGGRHGAFEVWPWHAAEVTSTAQIPVTPIRDWPENMAQERAFLIASRGWVDPQVLGFASEAAAKPDFSLYFDAADRDNAVNVLANKIAQATPSYKLKTVKPPAGGWGRVRGNVVLLYDPTKMSYLSSSTGHIPAAQSSKVSPHGPAGTTFEVDKIKEILLFFTTDAAKRKGKLLDTQHHRMFGGLL